MLSPKLSEMRKCTSYKYLLLTLKLYFCIYLIMSVTVGDQM